MWVTGTPASRSYTWALALLLGLYWPALARAEPSVVVLTPQGAAPRAGFVQALRIQLARTAQVTSGGVLSPGPLGARVRSASSRATELGALLAVWVEAGSDDPSRGELVLYLVGQRDGRALVDVLRLPSGDEAAADRSLALKVREAFDTVADATAQVQLAAALAEPVAAPPSVAAAPIALVVQTGALAVPTPGTTGLPWGWFALAGPELRFGQERMSGLLGARWLPSQQARRAGSSVSLSELAPTLSLGVSHDFDRLLLGLWLTPSLRILEAEGRTALGRRGSAQDVVAALLLGGSAELRLTRSFGLAFTLGVELLTPSPRYAINNQLVLDPGPARAVSGLMLVLRP